MDANARDWLARHGDTLRHVLRAATLVATLLPATIGFAFSALNGRTLVWLVLGVALAAIVVTADTALRPQRAPRQRLALAAAAIAAMFVHELAFVNLAAYLSLISTALGVLLGRLALPIILRRWPGTAQG